MFDDAELLQEFLAESSEHLDGIQDLLMSLEDQQKANNSVDSQTVDEVFRAIHSVKGGAGFLSLETIQSLSHVMENILGRIRDGELPATPEIISTLLQGTDHLTSLVNSGGESDDLDVSENIIALENILSGQQPKTGPLTEDLFTLVGEFGNKIHLKGDARTSLLDKPPSHCYLYTLTYSLAMLDENKQNPITILDQLSSFGTVIDSQLDEPKPDQSDADFTFSVIYATVFDPSIIDECSQPAPSKREALQSPAMPGIPQTEVQTNEPPMTDSHKPQTAPTVDQEQAKQHKEPAKSERLAEAPPAKESKQPQADAMQAIRVNTQLLDRLINLTGELVLVRNGQMRSMDTEKSSSMLSHAVKQLDQVTSELQEVALSLRMQPIGTILNKVPRMVRDLSRKLGKDIELTITGKDTDIDRSILEQLTDPLTHFIRNACDHGLETPDIRQAAGKAAKGNLTIEAFHEEGQVVIRIVDDGKGMDPEKLRQSAVEKGVLDKNDAANMSDQDALYLILGAGFSTADSVSEISGRGVGMDVVRKAIETIGGTITINSTLGKGSVFTLRLPLTLAILPALVVDHDNQPYAIPQAHLEEVVRVYPDDPQSIEYANDQAVFRLRDHLLPLVSLDNVLAGKKRLTHAELDDQQTITFAVLKLHGERFGLIIDSIQGTEEVVVKPLHDTLPHIALFTGTAILGDGQIALILDVDGLYKQYRPTVVNETNKDEENLGEGHEDVAHLLFRSHSKELLSIPLPLISRVVKISEQDIQQAAGKDVVSIDDELIRVLRINNHLPLQSAESENSDYFIIMPRHFRRPIGILVTDIVDTAVNIIPKADSDLSMHGIAGAALYDGNTTLMLDYYHLVEMEEPSWFKDQDEDEIDDPAMLRGMRALLAEDTPFFTKLVTGYLTQLGIDVLSAENGAEACRLLESHEFDLIVSDIEMPIMNGVQFAKQVRGEFGLDKIPLLALSSRNKPEEVAEALEAGFNAYETKIDKQRLSQALQALVRKVRK